LQVFLYAIEVDGRLLPGWSHVLVQGQHAQPFDSLKVTGAMNFHAGASDQVQISGIGEFVPNFPPCETLEPEVVKTVPYQFMPCGAVDQSQHRVEKL